MADHVADAISAAPQRSPKGGLPFSRRLFLGGLVASGAVAVAACAPAADAKASSSTGGSSSPTDPSLVPVTRQRIDSAVSALDGIVKGVMKSSGVPGMAVAVVHDDRVVYAKGFGVRQVGTSANVNADTVFLLASVSKSLASTVVARQVGQKVVSWSDPVVKYLRTSPSPTPT